MDYLNKDVNTLQPEALHALLPISDEALNELLERRQQRPFERLDELAEVPGIGEELLEELRESGALNFGPPVVDEGPFPEPTRVHERARRPPSLIEALAEGVEAVVAGLTGLLGTVILAERGGAGRGGQGGGLPPLRPGQRRRLSDALVSVPKASYDLTHAPPEYPGGPPGPLGYRWHFYSVTPPAYCAYVWILKGRIVGGRRVGSSALAAGAVGNGLVQTPAAAATDTVVEDMHRANEILTQCDFQFSLCGVHVLDVNQLTDINGANLADQLFDQRGTFLNPPSGGLDPLGAFYVAMQVQRLTPFHKDCYHIFYTAEVEDPPPEPDEPVVHVLGIGGSRQARERTPLTPMAVVEGGGRTIAHEAGHGLGEPHIDRSGDRRPGEPDFDVQKPDDRDNLLREVPQGEKLNAFQCRQMRAFIQRNKLRRGCP